MRPLPLSLIALALAGVATLLVLDRDAGATLPDPAAAPPSPVEIAPAVRMEFAPMHWAPGSIGSQRDARVAGEQPGLVVRVAEVGRQVRRGDPLAVLDDRALRLRERESEADVARIGSLLALARSQQDRYAQLAARQDIARAQFDQVRTEHDTLVQDHASARAQLAQVRHQRSQMVVRAPFDGVVAERHVQLGEFLTPGAAVARLVDVGAQEVRVRAPVALAPHLAPGARVRLRFDGGEQEHRVSALVPVGDDNSRQLELRIAIQGLPLQVGAAVDVGLPSGAPRMVVAVPRDALVLRREGDYVLRIGDDDRAERLPVDRGEEIDGLVEVEGDVQPGDRLVVRGGERLQSGQSVALHVDAGADARQAALQPASNGS